MAAATGPAAIAVGPDGTIYVSDFGIFPAGHPGGEVVTVNQNQPTDGFRLVGQDGKVYNFGDEASTNPLPVIKPSAKVVGIASTTSHHGYWEATADGNVYASGDATFDGSTPLSRKLRSKKSNEVSAVRYPSGNSTWTKPGSRFTIHSLSEEMPPACCEPSVRP